MRGVRQVAAFVVVIAVGVGLVSCDSGGSTAARSTPSRGSANNHAPSCGPNDVCLAFCHHGGSNGNDATGVLRAGTYDSEVQKVVNRLSTACCAKEPIAPCPGTGGYTWKVGPPPTFAIDLGRTATPAE